MTTTTTNSFKTNFLENNQGWSQIPNSPPPNTFEQDNISNKHNSRVHLRHFSANDSHCIRNSSYLASPSSSFLQQSTDHVIPEADNQQQRLRFDIILEAATAVTQKAEESAITYLNRGQVYGIQLNDKQGLNKIITSTLSIAFHSSSHRRIAESYWKFWVGQQKQTEVRAIDIDASQSTGISDLKFPSFDKITFNWNGRFGSKIYVRFKCLSTDFSRIKGVKGIPLRTQMESHIEENTSTGTPQIDEVCFCKVKLFRDKGAERKNKDDAKQISKQLEKVYGKANEQSLPLMYNVSIPYSVFGEIPTSSTLDSFEHAADDIVLPLQIKTPARYHTRVMTAPNSIFYQSHKANGPARGRKSISSIMSPFTQMSSDQQTIPPTYESSGLATPSINNFVSKTKENYDFHKYLTQQQQELAALPNIDTNDLQIEHARGFSSSSLLLHQSEAHSNYSSSINAAFDEDLPPLTSDTLHTPGTAQVTPTEFSHHGAFEKKIFLNNTSHILTPDLMMDNHIYNQPILSSIYDVFTPEEIQQPPESCAITPTQDEFFGGSTSPQSETNQQQPTNILYHQRDYFCSMESTSSHISRLQQQLQLHNESASNIMLNNSTANMLLLSPPPPLLTTHFETDNKKKRAHSDLIDRPDCLESNRILTYSSNPSHITLSSNCSSTTSSNCSINSDSANSSSRLHKKFRHHHLSP
ncbi:hypothetical protein HPULCUR_008175 [Helicostylum pulchrum]|uniref:Grh/CP2 DB domain-containing protein n=1 Tax=Helicostylum pulchrum TaxID=562976 RepID=A0ABP9Y6W7_9FUNG